MKFLKGKTTFINLKSVYPTIYSDDNGTPYVQWLYSPEIDEQCNRRSEAAKRGWKTRRGKQK